MRARPQGEPYLSLTASRTGGLGFFSRTAPAAIMAGISLLLAACLLVLAVPRLVAGLALLPGDGAVELMEAGTLPTEAGLKRAITAQVASLEAMPQPLPHLNIAYLSLALAEAGSSPGPEQADLLTVARHHLERALAMAPGDARAWSMLAALRNNQGNDLEAAARALTLSFAANPHMPLLAPFRWPASLILQARLDAVVRRQADAEFLTFFRLHPDSAVRTALHGDRLRELRAVAATSEVDARRLASVLERLGAAGS